MTQRRELRRFPELPSKGWPPVLKDSSRQMLTVFSSLAPGSGFSPSLLWGVWAHETGEGSSRLWTGSLNPGGIKFSRDFFITCCFSQDQNGRDSKYPNPVLAAAALVFFLRQARYSRARGLPDHDAIAEIGKAGYVEHTPGEPANWISGVSRFCDLASQAL